MITSIIIADLDQGKFNLLNFYERRIRRILPALFLVVMFCIPIAWLFFAPGDYRDFSQSLAAIPLFFSNVLFWQEGGYFQSASELKPLLHTWSLAIEEQYYVIFPLFLLWFWKTGRKVILSILILSLIVSLGIAEWGLLHDPEASFYLLPMRGWELLIGALAAFFIGRSKMRLPTYVDQFGSIVGIALIAYAVFYFDKSTPFPGLSALVPTVGTVLVILFARPGTIVNRLLSVNVMVGIGLISYSAYLWHQPLLAFTRYRSLLEPSDAVILGICLLTFIIAYISWKYVEKPFRNSEVVQRKTVFWAGAFSAIGIFSIGVMGHAGVVTSYDHLVNPEYYVEFFIDREPRTECEEFPKRNGISSCFVYGTGNELTVIWGDSHADAIQAGISKDLVEQFGRLMVISHLGCPPVMDVVNLNGVNTKESCRDIDDLRSFAEYIDTRKPHRILLVSRWSGYLHGWHRLDELQDASHFLTTNEYDNSDMTNSRKILKRQLSSTANYFGNVPIYVVGQLPDLQHLTLRQRRILAAVPSQKIRDWHKVEEELIGPSSGKHKYINVRERFCDQDACVLKENGQDIYRDDNHVNNYGAKILLEHIYQNID